MPRGFVTKTYSFLDTHATISAPSGSFDIADSGGVANEGITITMIADKDVMTIGANGDGMHTLVASDAGRVEIALLKEGPGNAMLNALYRYQKQSAATWGGIQLTLQNPSTGDAVTCAGGAFIKQSDLGYRTEAGNNVWAFNFVFVDEVLGNGFQPTNVLTAV